MELAPKSLPDDQLLFGLEETEQNEAGNEARNEQSVPGAWRTQRPRRHAVGIVALFPSSWAFSEAASEIYLLA